MLAFILVVGLMVVMLAFTTGMKRMTEGTGEPANVLVLSEGADDEVFSNLDAAMSAKMESLPVSPPRRRRQAPVASRETYSDRQPAGRSIPGRAGPGPLPADPRHGRCALWPPAYTTCSCLASGKWFSQAGTQEDPDWQSPTRQT